MRKIAALYVETGGCYFGLPHVDPWDINRNANSYPGDDPVVAHPPCQLWGALAYVNYKRWGGEHNKPGNDKGCFFNAVEKVLLYGGVLEHPAFSRAWRKYGLLRPTAIGAWQFAGNDCWVCEVWQSAYGHKAQKRTWLFYHGSRKPMDLRWDREKGTHQIGQRDQRGKERNKPTLSKKEANATPIEFRDALIALAQNA